MRRRSIRWLFLLAWLVYSHAAGTASETNPLRNLMSKPTLGDTWQKSEKAKFYDKDTLFDLVDGEAEAYFPYGFKAAASAVFEKKGDKTREATLELLEMGSLLDAFGIFSSMRDGESKKVDVGTEGFGGDAQIMFYVDRYFVRATVLSESAASELKGFAKAIAGELPSNKNKPAEVSLVAIPGLVPRSEQYIAQSLLGYAFWPKGIIAKIKTKDATARVFVVLTDSASDAQVALQKYVQEATARGAKVQTIDDDGQRVVVLNDAMQQGVAVSQAGKYLIGAADLKEPEKQGPALLRQLRKRVLAAGK
jgi:hypothetical protein